MPGRPERIRGGRHTRPMDEIPVFNKVFGLVAVVALGLTVSESFVVKKIASRYGIDRSVLVQMNWDSIAMYAGHLHQIQPEEFRQHVVQQTVESLMESARKRGYDQVDLTTEDVFLLFRDTVLARNLLIFLLPALFLLIVFGELHILYQVGRASYRLLWGILVPITFLPFAYFLHEWWKTNTTVPEALASIFQDSFARGLFAFILSYLPPHDWSAWLHTGLIFALLPALGEELIFRGMLLRWFLPASGKGAGVHLSVLVTALLFAVSHLNWGTLLATFVAGVFLGYLYVWTGSVWTPVLMHALFNGTQFALAYLHFSEHPYAERIFSWMEQPETSLVMGVATIVLMVLLYRVRVRPFPRIHL